MSAYIHTQIHVSYSCTFNSSILWISASPCIANVSSRQNTFQYVYNDDDDDDDVIYSQRKPEINSDALQALVIQVL